MRCSRLFLAAGLVASIAAAAEAGVAYQKLKTCLKKCIETTEPMTGERAACGLDCVLDYLDDKFSLGVSVGFDPASTGYASAAGLPWLDTSGQNIALLEVAVRPAPGDARAIAGVRFTAITDHAPDGLVLGFDPARGDGRYGLVYDAAALGPAGYIIAEVIYAGAADTDEVGVIRFGRGPAR